MKQLCATFFFIATFLLRSFGQHSELLQNHVVWTTQSQNSGASMPCGGGDVGLNVWVENGDVYAYVARSGTFDVNNTLLKLGRVKISLSPNPFNGQKFKQELVLKDGYVQITGQHKGLEGTVKVWVDVFRPIVHFEVSSNQKITTTAAYQSWRFDDRITKGKENNQNSYKWAPQGVVKTAKDSINFIGNAVQFYHKNEGTSVFDIAVKQQGLVAQTDQMFNPLKNLIFGGTMQGPQMIRYGSCNGKYLSTPYKEWQLQSIKPSKTASIELKLVVNYGSLASFKQELVNPEPKLTKEKAFVATKKWWNDLWERSFVYINSYDSIANQTGRNYQLFRYMLACNAFGKWPTKFNGGLFTYDPELTDSTQKFTPDFRNWGGGTHTAQNQRLVYWPMLKNGDFEMLRPQFEFYRQLLPTAELRTQQAWGHPGASFTEQLENFGLPNPAEYGWKRPAGYNQGMEYNAWLEYEWDTALEFCMMILESNRYNGTDIKPYLPLIESCLKFFKEHYLYLAKQRGAKSVDENGHLVFYPGSAAETYKMAYNASSTVAGLQTVLKRLIEYPSLSDVNREEWKKMLSMIPPISFREVSGKTMIAPAKVWERINNTESPQLYPVFPWGIYGVGKPGIDTALNTYLSDPDVLKFRSHVGWKQDNIFAARLGLTDEAVKLNLLKLKDSGRRFPAFWGPGFDWTPDHNWGGSGMIGLQEMLMQCDGKKIFLCAAWPKKWNVHFKLHAPYQTTVEARVIDGNLEIIKVFPSERKSDIINMLK